MREIFTPLMAKGWKGGDILFMVICENGKKKTFFN